MLDPINEQDLYALHFTFLPRISQALSKFQDGWNGHGIRAEYNMTPNQLFTYGALQLQHTGLAALDFFQQISDDYGIDDSDPVLANDSIDEGVSVPRVNIGLDEEQLEQLQNEVNPLQESEKYRIDIYHKAIEILNRFL